MKQNETGGFLMAAWRPGVKN